MLDSFDELVNVWNAQISQEEGSLNTPVFDWVDRTVFQTMGIFAFNKNTKSIEIQDSGLYHIYVEMAKQLATPTLLLHILKFSPKTVKHLPYYSEFYALIKRLRKEFQQIINYRRDELVKMNDAEKKAQRDVLARILLNPNRQSDYDDMAIVVHT